MRTAWKAIPTLSRTCAHCCSGLSAAHGSADQWRILVGPDAHKIDELVRRSPGRAYDVDFFEQFAREVGWPCLPDIAPTLLSPYHCLVWCAKAQIQPDRRHKKIGYVCTNGLLAAPTAADPNSWRLKARRRFKFECAQCSDRVAMRPPAEGGQALSLFAKMDAVSVDK